MSKQWELADYSMAFLGNQNYFYIKSSDGRVVAKIATRRTGGPEKYEEAEANARLLVAAPKLLEALKFLLPSLVMAEYRMRVNDWAEGSPKECDDSPEGREAMRAYHLVLVGIQESVRKALAAIAEVESENE